MTQRWHAVIFAALAGCHSTAPATGPAAPPATLPAPAADTPVPAAGPPATAPQATGAAIGPWGFDLAGMNKTVAPGNSFFRYANGTWLATTQIPADKSNVSMFSVLTDLSNERTRTIIEAASGPPGSNAQRIGDCYKAFMDEPAIEAKGLAPIQPRLAEIAKIKDVAGVVHEIARRSREGGNSPLNAGVAQDDRQPDKYIATLSQGGLGLPDRDMYDAKAAQFAPLRDAYKKYIAQMFTLIGGDHAAERAALVYALEEQIAATHWTRIQNRDPQKTYNKTTIAQLRRLAPSLSWQPWLAAVGFTGQPVLNINQPSAIAGAARLIASQPVAVWKDYLTIQAVTDMAPYLPRRFVDAHFEMFGKALGGTPENQERWKRGVDQVSEILGEAVGEIYVAKYFTPETKAHADQLVKNLLAAMGQRIDGLAWMSPETKAKARQKLATYNPKIGYPKQWRDYAALTIKPDDALGNARRLASFEAERQLAKLGKPVDRNEWGMTPMTVNAYYNPVLNEIVFPAAVLQPPFFDAKADDAVNYGGIGTVIGHEISHGFDDQGAQYDETGALSNWWTKDDTDKFKAATARLVAQYSAYCPFPAGGGKPAQCVKGELTLGENIADLAGIAIAYSAYKLSLGGKPAPVLDGFTADQRFFLGFAQNWRRLYRDQELANRLVTDPHSPAEFRAAVVRNIDPWYDAFQPKPGEALYLAPDQRVKIW
jgi:putative endopeptidase